MRQLAFSLLLLLFAAGNTIAQTVIFSENFDGCALSPGWQVNASGNQNPTWYVGPANLNNDNNGQSMNGSCFLFIDDDATGDNTPAYVLDFVSPPFDASQFPTVSLSVDVHYRDWASADEHFDVLVTDGVTETLLRRYDKFRSTGSNLYQFETFTFDLALVTHSPNARLIFRYDDAAGFNWWAGVDNISVIGEGEGTNVIAESFNSCEKPAGWETQIVTGVDDWKFGFITAGSALGGSNSMNGSCFVYFDDDILGQDTPFSTVRLISPWFDGTQFGQFKLNFDIILRYYSEKIAVIVQHGNGEEFIVRETNGDVGGPYFQNFQNWDLDLSPYRSQQMRLVFEFDDGQDWGWWGGLDNVKVTGFGAANDICSNAQVLLTGSNCIAGNNSNAVLDGPDPQCVEKALGGLWYTWTADFSGTARISTRARFNELVEVYTGDCASPQLIFCNNRDEHGFTGEVSHFEAIAGQQYLIRVSGREGGFGQSRGAMCISIEQGNPPVPPANDDCAGALPLALDTPCAIGANLGAGTSATIPQLNELARHDIWYSFSAPAVGAGEKLVLQSNADFSDIITVFTGACNALEEAASNHKGGRLEMPALTEGQTCYVQISGSFATIEGHVCPELFKKSEQSPANDQCLEAVAVNVGGACVSGSTLGAGKSGYIPPCVPDVAGDVWFSFVAPASGSVRLNSGAAFEHVLAVWKGDCAQLEPVMCDENPLRCDGYLLLGALSAGSTYYVQIATRSGAISTAANDFCLHIVDGANQPPFVPIALLVNEKCVSTNVSELQIEVQGGVTPYTFSGAADGTALNSGQEYLVVVSDAIGCQKAIIGKTEDCEAIPCALTGTFAVTHPLCTDATNGVLAAGVTGGTPPYQYLWSNAATTMEINGLSTGSYTATVTDALGCEIVITDTIVSPPAIVATPSNIQQPHQGLSDGAILLDVSGGNGNTYIYAWTLNGQIVSNSEDLLDAPAGDYHLVITDINGCTASFDFTLTETVGNQEQSEAFFVEIYPNPAVDKAWLSVSFPTPQSLHLSILDAAGKLLHTWTVKQATEQNIPLDLTHLPSGAYQLRIKTATTTWSEPLIVGKRP